MDKSVISDDEEIQATIRRHWINITPIAVAFVLIGVGVLYSFYLLGRYGDSFGRSGSVPLVAIGLLAVLALDFLLGYSSWWVYIQNRLIVTDKNLYQITQNSLFSRRVSQFSLERLQDITASQNGFWASTFDYGDVTAETAGEEDNFVFNTAPRPQKLATWIMACHKHAGGGPAPSNDF